MSESGSSAPSIVTVTSRRSKDYPPEFSVKRPRERERKMINPLGESTSSTASFLSEKSHRSKDYPPEFSVKPRRKRERTCEESSTFSFKSQRTDRSKDYPPEFSDQPVQQKKIIKPPGESASSTTSFVSEKSHRSKDRQPNFSYGPLRKKDQTTASIQQIQDIPKVFESEVMDCLKHILKKHEKLFKENQDDEDDQELEIDDETKEAAMKIALHVLRNMKEDEYAHIIEQSHYGVIAMYQKILKPDLKMKNECLLENTQKWPVPLQKIYTEIYLIEGESGEVNQEHEVRQVEAAFNKRKSLEIKIRCENVFKPLPNQVAKPIRTVLTKGIAGIGKTVLTQKFMLDWSTEKANQDIQLLFSLPFRELNLLKNETRSLMELLCNFSPGLKESGITDLNKYKVLVVLDGLDECRLPLDFDKSENCCDTSQSASVQVLMTNLIAGHLLPHAYLWITTRPAAASRIPGRYVDHLTEIRGFNKMQKEDYSLKKIDDENLAKRVIANIKSTRSLYIMCHVPVFCWISSIVLGEMCAQVGGGKMPKTLTQMYIHFLAHQTAQIYVKYGKEQQLDSQGNNKLVMSLGKLAFDQLEKGNLQSSKVE